MSKTKHTCSVPVHPALLYTVTVYAVPPSFVLHRQLLQHIPYPPYYMYANVQGWFITYLKHVKGYVSWISAFIS